MHAWGSTLRIWRRVVWAVVALVPVGCVSASATNPKIRDAQAAILEQRAVASCQGPPPDYAFRTDGCSLWPDGSWGDCCVEHDLAYWCGGSRAARTEADRRLRACVAERVGGTCGELLGIVVQGGTFVGGVPWLPTPWRWGYGRAFPAGYESGNEIGREGGSGDSHDTGPAGSVPSRER